MVGHFRQRFAGAPLKRVALRMRAIPSAGEAVITHYGIEGGAIYALSQRLRDTIEAAGEATLIDRFAPDMTQQRLARKLGKPRGKQSLSTFLRKAANLSPAAIGLLQEAAAGKLGALPAGGSPA